jgi:hypothetical protein
MTKTRTHTTTTNITSAADETPLPRRPIVPVTDELIQRLTTLLDPLELAMAVLKSLQTQHAAAQRTIEILGEKVVELEVLVKAQAPAPAKLAPDAPTELTEPGLVVLPTEPVEPAAVAAPPPAPPTQAPQPDSLTQMFSGWKKSVEGQWSSVHKE